MAFLEVESFGNAAVTARLTTSWPKAGAANSRTHFVASCAGRRGRSTRSELPQNRKRDHPRPPLLETTRVDGVKAPQHRGTPRSDAAFNSFMSIWPLPSVSKRLKASRTSSISSSLKPARFLGLRPPANARAPDSAPKRARPDMAWRVQSPGPAGGGGSAVVCRELFDTCLTRAAGTRRVGSGARNACYFFDLR